MASTFLRKCLPQPLPKERRRRFDNGRFQFSGNGMRLGQPRPAHGGELFQGSGNSFGKILRAGRGPPAASRKSSESKPDSLIIVSCQRFHFRLQPRQFSQRHQTMLFWADVVRAWSADTPTPAQRAGASATVRSRRPTRRRPAATYGLEKAPAIALDQLRALGLLVLGFLKLFAEDDLGQAFRAHDGDFGCRPGRRRGPHPDPAAHCEIGAAGSQNKTVSSPPPNPSCGDGELSCQ